MKLREVRATAFGPFRNKVLTLTPGMNVVHGPNEAGKSSWFAATYAGLAGRRRVKGRGTAVQAEFAKRHKPWSGSQWSAGVTIALDDGLVLAIEHDLRKGESRIVDSESGQPIAVSALESRLGVDLVNDGTLDGSRLLGLNRDSVRATIFSGQADMLRVLSDAKELQEFIERAATTDVADSTAEGALGWLASLRSELVGVEHIGNKPLRARTAEQLRTRQVSSERRDALTELIGTIDNQRAISGLMAQAKVEVDRADLYDRWVEWRSDSERLNKATELSEQIAALGADAAVVDEDRIQEATMILGAYDAGAEPAPLADGPTAAALEADLAALPLTPEGDVEPRPEILAARQAYQDASTALQTHAATAPEATAGAATTDFSAEDLRSMATLLEAKPPAVDPARRDEVAVLIAQADEAGKAYQAGQAAYGAAIGRNEQRRLEHMQATEEFARQSQLFDKANADRTAAAASAQNEGAAKRRRAGLVLGVGIALVVLGGVLAAAVMPALGTIAVVGLAVLIVGTVIRLSGSGQTVPANQAPLAPPRSPDVPQMEQVVAPVAPPVDPRIQDLQVALRSDESATETHLAKVASIRSLLSDQGIADDPVVLRAHARAQDDAGAASERQQAHSRLTQDFARKQETAGLELARVLRDVGAVTDGPIDGPALLAAVDSYVESCRLNAEVAAQAGRRADLTSALEQRRLVEDAHARSVADRASQGAAVIDFVRRHVGSGDNETVTVPMAVEEVRHWLSGQQAGRTSQGARAELVARLDQLLEGGDLEVQRQALSERAATLGPEPVDPPADLDAFRDQVTARHGEITAREAALGGQRDHLSQGLKSVAEAVETEASADRALAEVQTLRDCINAATEQLQLAKDRAHANIAPALEAKIRPWLPKITDGRYLDVVVDPSDLTIKVTEATGAAREARLLSQGTMEQIFLILRIALSQVLSGDGESAPFVLDDVTVQSDADRTIAILQMLHALSRTHQVVLFTQEAEVVDWARANLGDGEWDSLVAL
ncbi:MULTISPECIES: AAA family ATPase [unclassified Nocardioides]|uniref:AAA family ATPase n=1 Tax=unclassified Nocardioides TaxID=2615069 RepID=UPI000701CBE5|nr:MULTISPECIES: AAA family ATPase [unclassified Nocardioides]KRA37895.1 hypothetical protein ASD81_04215 [Nocardioides sp. Root614]KRA91855.1 hypothetical protein ASD84_04480 [Nocardioides sp. Root682]